ncbi:MAG: chorismate mutase [Steroidobacteraceae bacterium]
MTKKSSRAKVKRAARARGTATAAANANKEPRAAGSQSLATLRDEIDSVDRRIHELLNARAGLARRVAESKQGLVGSAIEFYRPEREAQVLRMAKERNQGPLRDEEILRLFREIMSACLAQEEPLKVAFLGPEGTFTQTAVLKHFGHSVTPCHCYRSMRCFGRGGAC